MPQITYIPSQNVASEIGSRAFERLFDNMAANVKYREDRQALKNAEAQKMSMKMALGLVPKSKDMVFTDNGQEFTNADAQSAYYEALRGKMGDQPMDREGYTNSQVDGIEESKALQQRQIDESTTKDENQFAQELRNAARRGIRTTETLRETDPTLITRGSETPDANVYAPERDMTKQAEVAKSVFAHALGLSSATAEQLAQKTAAAQEPSAPASAPTVAASKPTDKPQNTKTKITAGATVSDGTKVSERDQSSVKIKTPDVTIKNPIVGTTTTDRQSARIDDLKTSYWNLLGLKSAEDAAGSFAVYDNPQYAVANKGTFDIALQRRQDQINNWEKAASEDGTTQKAEQFGTQEYSKTGTDLDLSSTRANALANQTNIEMRSGNVNATQNPGSDNTQGRYEFKSHGNADNSVETDAVGNILRGVNNMKLDRGIPFKDGGQLRDQLTQQIADNINTQGWRVESNGSNPGLIKVVSPDKSKTIQLQWDKELVVPGKTDKGDWKVSATPGVSIGTLQLVVGGQFKKTK